MNCLLLTEADFIDSNRVRITGRRLEQLVSVIKIQPGKELKSGVRNGALGMARVLSCDAQQAELEFFPQGQPPAPANLTLIMAMQRPQTFGKVLHCAVTMGVKRICFIQTFKVEKSYWQSSVLQEENLAREITLALEQCCDTMPPEITFHRRFRPFVEDELDPIARNSLRLFGDPVPDTAFPVAGSSVTLLLGPEGGLNEFETNLLRTHGFLAVSLGARILRTEFALAALLAKLI